MQVRELGLEILEANTIERFSLELIHSASHLFHVSGDRIVLGLFPRCIEYKVIGWDATQSCVIAEFVPEASAADFSPKETE